MLSKKHRLSRNEFKQHFKTGKRTHSSVGTVIFSPNLTFHGAVVVSKKVSKKAVTRNTLRRRVYTQLYRAFKEKRAGVYIVVLKPKFATLSKKEQHKKITELIAGTDQNTYNTAHV